MGPMWLEAEVTLDQDDSGAEVTLDQDDSGAEVSGALVVGPRWLGAEVSVNR